MPRCLAAALSALVLLVPAAAEAATKAGVAVRDATWHVGASGGQFSDDTGPLGAEGADPHAHSTKKRISDGVALRTSTRALVVADAQGDRVAIVANDLYLSQDFLNRRVAGLLAEHDREVTLGLRPGPATGITGENLAITASHNHNTPFYSTPGWGTAIFQDVYDLRFYDYMARQMADAVIAASARLVPVRMSGTTRRFDEIQSHTYGPKVGDDGTPAGQPYGHTTRQLTVVRFDDVSDRDRPRHLANWVTIGIHPEYTWGYDLINGDITHAAARMVDRELGTLSVFSQRETGTSGPHKDQRVHPSSARREFQDNGFAQLDRAARLLADGILAAIGDIEAQEPERVSAFQPWIEDFDVATVSQRFAPPTTRPFPGVSNCNTASLFHGDPRLPVLGLPDCQSTHATAPLTPVTAPLYTQLKELGVPIPESYSATKLTAVEETAAVHLMAVRLGDTVATMSPTEQFTDTALNIETRLDRVAGNLWTGFDWAGTTTPAGRDFCVREGDGWRCADPRYPANDLPLVDDRTYRRFRAQIHNDASGWEDDLATLGSEAEPADPAKIKGNFTHEEHTAHGYSLVISVGMANDYWGYMPEYREFRSHDHYRKALSGLGPHGADFVATRISRMAASLKGAPAVALRPLDLVYQAESARAEAAAQGLGEAGRAVRSAYDRAQPADGPAPAVLEQPADLERFGAAHVVFGGGSNWTDLPDVVVERRSDGGWKRFGDLDGEVQIMVGFPRPGEELAAARAGSFRWRWTAAFEAYSSDVEQPDAAGVTRAQTPVGDYRFVIRGRHRAAAGAGPRPYELVSRTFTVGRYTGLTAEDLRTGADGSVSFVPGLDYPDTYASPFRFLTGEKLTKRFPGQEDQVYCRKCTFRPWADRGTLVSATVVTSDGRELAAHAADGGRWATGEPLAAGESVERIELVDAFGETS